MANSDEENQLKIKDAAYHEAAHAAMAIYFGFNVTGIRLDRQSSGNGVTGIDYGSAKEIVKIILKSYSDENVINELSADGRKQALQLSTHLLQIVLAGPVGSAISDETVNELKEVTASGPDLEIIDATTWIMQAGFRTPEDKIISHSLKQVKLLLTEGTGKKAIDSIVHELMNSEDLFLEGDRIHQICEAESWPI